MEVCYIYANEDSIMRLTKLFKRGGKGEEYNGRGEFVQDTLCAYVWNYHNEIPSSY
jgi:hypothetical protein